MRQIVGILLVSLLLLSCTQKVWVRLEPYLGDRLVIDGKDEGVIPKHGRHVEIKRTPGAVPYSVWRGSEIIQVGVMERTRTNAVISGFSIASGAVGALGGMLVGAIIASPAWIFLPLNAAPGQYGAFLLQGASLATVPVATIGAMIGASPMLGVLASGEVDDAHVIYVRHAGSTP